MNKRIIFMNVHTLVAAVILLIMSAAALVMYFAHGDQMTISFVFAGLCASLAGWIIFGDHVSYTACRRKKRNVLIKLNILSEKNAGTSLKPMFFILPVPEEQLQGFNLDGPLQLRLRSQIEYAAWTAKKNLKDRNKDLPSLGDNFHAGFKAEVNSVGDMKDWCRMQSTEPMEITVKL